MPRPNYEKRRPPQDPYDGKGVSRYSRKVGTATDAMGTNDVDDFDRRGWPGEPHRDAEPAIQDAVNPVSVIANFSRLGEALKKTGTYAEVAKQIAGIAEMAEATVMQEAGDWFDGHTVKRNMSELKKHAGAFVKLAQEMDMMQQRSTALYDDMGNVLARYFEMAPLQDADPFGGKKAPPFDGPGGNPEDDEGRRKHDAQDGVLDDAGEPFGGKKAAPFDGPGGNPEDDEGREEWDARDGVLDDEIVEGIVDSVMERILPEKGEPTEFRARKTLRTPKSFARPHQDMTHDQAKDLLRKTGATTVEQAKRVFEALSSVQLKKKEAAIREVVDKKTAGKVEGKMLDLFTASGMVQVMDALNPQNKKKFLNMPVAQMAEVTFKLMKR